MSRSVTVREILDRLDTGRITALSAPGIIRALCDGIEVLEAEAEDLRARVAELEADLMAAHGDPDDDLDERPDDDLEDGDPEWTDEVCTRIEILRDVLDDDLTDGGYDE